MKKSNLDNSFDCASYVVETTSFKEITIVRTHKKHTKRYFETILFSVSIKAVKLALNAFYQEKNRYLHNFSRPAGPVRTLRYIRIRAMVLRTLFEVSGSSFFGSLSCFSKLLKSSATTDDVQKLKCIPGLSFGF